MNKQIILSVLAAAVIGSTGCVSVKEVKIFGQDAAIIKTRDLVAPCTTSIVDKDLKPITTASGPGFVPGVAGAAGTATQGALYPRPKHNTSTSVSVEGGDVSATGGNGNGGAGGVGGGSHPNSPGNGGQPGAGGANNPNQ